MSQFTPQKKPTANFDGCYCLNPNCQHPQNFSSDEICNSCGAQLLLQGQYRAIEPIGAGGFGRTFLAVDELQPAQKRCAIKQFFPQQTGNTQKASELFREEAQRLKQLGNYPQIPQMLGYFERNGHQYLVQEWIAGCNLAQELAEEGSFNETKIRQLLNDLLPVLGFVHNHQIIHRDIKPENIIRRQADSKLVLVDFGAAKLATETALAKTGTMIGSAAYTAPEQTKGKAIFASDIYSLGVTCIHLMTQVAPFDLFDSGEDRWVWRDYLRKPVSPQLGKVLDKMLQSATKRRYESTTEILTDLNATPSALSKTKNKVLLGGTVIVVGWTAGMNLLNTLFPPQPTYYNSPVSQEYNVPVKPIAPPQSAGLFTADNQQKTFPLQHTEVKAKISGNVSRVEVTQTFANPYKEPLEAIYTFPLPDEAAVDDMEIRVGNRVIRGLIKKREEAKQIYRQAKQQGKTAGLLEQERDNIFTQSLANIKPGEKIDVTIRYTESLKFEGGDYEFVFPMVVGPRYIPGNSVADAAKLNPPISATRSGQDINVTVDIDAGVPITEVRSPSHQMAIQRAGSTMEVKLAGEKTIPNKDLILRYKVAGASTQATVLTQSDEKGGHFATYLIPAVKYDPNQIVPKDVVFLMDTSGSQAGAAIQQSQELMRQFINGLNPEDTFTIIDFASTTTQLSSNPLPNTPSNRQKAIAYVNGLSANGGSELMNGMNKVLDFPPAPKGRLRSVVLLTDGLIGNDFQVIAEVQKRLKAGNRLYSFGVGSSTNRFLINRLAELGRGTAEIVPPHESGKAVAQKFFREINNPVLTNIEITWVGSGKPAEIYPLKAADLFASQPLVLFGRKQDRKNGQIRITGTIAGGQRYEKILNVNFDQVSGNSAISQLWGRARIKDLMNQMYGAENLAGVKAVTDTALAYRLLSQYTAFVAVSEEVRVDSKNPKRQEVVPVVIPKRMNKQLSSGSLPANADVPEPSQVLGMAAGFLLLGIGYSRKRRRSKFPVD
ncbi:VIT domain-containing protein [Microcoleus sp. FACHB-672]|uniref:VIT domain-containing protein n=1 Tax=Microcoleus sp. FACHB-672 TaxID=2692825 RepID=UPI001686B728|nr:VIT domain-containing protein [Microcoleus sp. FACHB-672]MBD2042998.1 protein kinase [Microcoleus sp. FACHB-672]